LDLHFNSPFKESLQLILSDNIRIIFFSDLIKELFVISRGKFSEHQPIDKIHVKRDVGAERAFLPVIFWLQNILRVSF